MQVALQDSSQITIQPTITQVTPMFANEDVLNYLGASLLAVVIIAFVIYIIVKNISLNEAFASRAVAIFSVFQVLQILSEMIVIAYFAYGNFYVNVMRVLPFSTVEFLSASAFIVLSSSIIAGKFKKLWVIAVLILTSAGCFAGIVIMCSMIYDIWSQVMGYTIMIHTDDALGFGTVASEIPFRSGDLATAYNIWSTPVISAFAVGFLLLKYIDEKITADAKAKQQSQNESKNKKPKGHHHEPPSPKQPEPKPQVTETIQGVTFVENILAIIDLCMFGSDGEEAALSLAFKALNIKDLGPAYPEQARYSCLTNETDASGAKKRAFIKWEESLNWRKLSHSTIIKLRDLFKSDSGVVGKNGTNTPPIQKVKNILIEGIKEYYGVSS